ncbi:MAG: CHASE3 domain-containing protein [Bryobacteraceae bacterium]
MASLSKTSRLIFAAAALVLLCSSLLTLYTSTRWSSEGKVVAEAHAALARLQNLQAAVTDAETCQRGYLLTGDPRYLENYENALVPCREALKEIGRTGRTPTERRNASELRADPF